MKGLHRKGLIVFGTMLKKGDNDMKKYATFIDKATHSLTMTKSYESDDEYFKVMDSIDSDLWEITFEQVER